MSEPDTSPSGNASDAQNRQDTHLVVGVGASAGGLNALKHFLPTLPAGSNLSIVIVVHLAAGVESHLAELLQRHSEMPVSQVTEDTPLESNRVYVIPPGLYLSAVDSHLRLKPVDRPHSRRAPINHFFRTLAETYDGSSVGVILTGTGSDGAEGLRYIREQGGLTIAQEPAEAEFDGMPRAAIEAGFVDRVLRIDEIVPRILEFSAARPNPPRHAGSEGADSSYLPEEALTTILTALRIRTGHDFLRYKRSTAARRVLRRMQVLNLTDVEEYLGALRRDDSEVRALVNDLLINVTKFFRDPDVFKILGTDVIPKLFDGKTRVDSIRVWSVGCSTGEEPYSIGILLLEEAGRRIDAPQIQVFATDLHEPSLQIAREALFSELIEEDVSKDRLERFFRREGAGYRVAKHLRDSTVFALHNVLRDPPFSHLDLILCRNLLIYFQRDIQDETIQVLHYALREGGRIVLGSAESFDHSHLFRPELKAARVYLRREVPRTGIRVPPLALVPSVPTLPLSRAGANLELSRSVSGFGAVHARMAARYGAPSVLVSPDHEVVFVSAGASRYLEYAGGEPSTDLFKVVREELRAELRTALHFARGRDHPWQSQPISLETEGAAHWISLRVNPSDEPELDGFALVSFVEIPAVLRPRLRGDGEGDVRTQELNAELSATQARMQAVIEETEATQEEMRASNEELQSANEELRSTLEELETSREELQSVNEELQTLNQENRHKVEELSELSSDLQNLLQATDVATLFLDKNLRILRYTPRVTQIFSIREADRGRPLADLTHALRHSTLIHDAHQVLKTLVPVELETTSSDGESHYLLRFAPYRTVDDRIEGLVLTLIDVTQLKRIEFALRARDDDQAFLIRLQDAVSGLTAVHPMLSTAVEMIAEHLSIESLSYLNVTDEVAVKVAAYGKGAEATPVFCGLNEIRGDLQESLRRGEAIAASDTNGDLRLTDQQRRRCETASIRALAFALQERPDSLKPALLATSRTPRSWTQRELIFLADVLRRLCHAAEKLEIESNLTAVQERFRLIVECARDYAIVTMDDEGRIVSWSPGAEEIFGWSSSEAIGQHVALIFSREDQEAGVPNAELTEARLHGRASDKRWHVRKDGARVFIDGSTRAITDPTDLIAFFKIGQDVTRRLELEENLRDLNLKLGKKVAKRTRQLATAGDEIREAGERYRNLFESMEEGFCVVEVLFDTSLRPVDYRFLELNPAFERLSGIHDGKGKLVSELVAQNEPSWLNLFGGVALSGTPERCERAPSSLGGWYEIYAFRIGAVEERRVAALFSDITNKKHLEIERDSLRLNLLEVEEEERRRLSRELHDEAGQHLTTLSLGLKALFHQVPLDSAAARKAQELSVLSEMLGRKLHAVAVRLRPRALDDFGLEAATRSLAEDWSGKSNIPVDFHIRLGPERLPAPIETAIYRIVQEALTNVTRHAAATRASIGIERQDGHVFVVIEDDGRGFPQNEVEAAVGSGLGLAGIYERAALLHGSVSVESAPGAGTTILARLPVRVAHLTTDGVRKSVKNRPPDA